MFSEKRWCQLSELQETIYGMGQGSGRLKIISHIPTNNTPIIFPIYIPDLYIIQYLDMMQT